MKMFNPVNMWFSSKSLQKLEDESGEEKFPQLTKEDILKTIDVKYNEESIMDVKSLSNQIDTICGAIKNALGINEVEQPIEDAQSVEVSEETEAVQEEQIEESKNEVEENEPSETETVETEPAEETVEEQEVEQEEPKEVVEEEPAVEEEKPEAEETENEEVEVEEAPAEEVEEEPIEEITNEVEVIEEPVPAVTDIIETADKTSELLQEIEALKAEKAEKELKIQKMSLAKEIEKDFIGVPGKIEDKVDLIFEIKNSALSENAKSFILTSLKSLSAQNLSDCEEIGHEQEVEVDEKAEQQSKIQNLMEKEGLTENQAFLVVNNFRTLAEAKKASAKVRRK